MNVNPFSRATKFPLGFHWLAGFRASMDPDAAVLLSASHLQQAESRTPKGRSRVF